MENPNVSPNESNQEHSTFYDQADAKFNKSIEKLRGEKEKDLRSEAEEEVRENEDASLQDDSYAFDEANTGTEEYHDADDAMEYVDYDNDEDII